MIRNFAEHNAWTNMTRSLGVYRPGKEDVICEWTQKPRLYSALHFIYINSFTHKRACVCVCVCAHFLSLAAIIEVIST